VTRVTRDPIKTSKVKVTRPLWVAVQVTTCRRLYGHIVAAALQAAAQVSFFVSFLIFLFEVGRPSAFNRMLNTVLYRIVSYRLVSQSIQVYYWLSLEKVKEDCMNGEVPGFRVTHCSHSPICQLRQIKIFVG